MKRDASVLRRVDLAVQRAFLEGEQGRFWSSQFSEIASDEGARDALMELTKVGKLVAVVHICSENGRHLWEGPLESLAGFPARVPWTAGGRAVSQDVALVFELTPSYRSELETSAPRPKGEGGTAPLDVAAPPTYLSIDDTVKLARALTVKSSTDAGPSIGVWIAAIAAFATLAAAILGAAALVAVPVVEHWLATTPPPAPDRLRSPSTESPRPRLSNTVREAGIALVDAGAR